MPGRPAPIHRWLSPGGLVLSAILFAAATLCYALQPDACAAVTFWPAWAWLLMGLVLAALAARHTDRRALAGVLVLWLVFTTAFVEETGSLIRLRRLSPPGWQRADLGGRALRVISLNCAGSRQAAAEVAPYQPDIVLMQESPAPREVERLARRIFPGGGVVVGLDGAIIVRGQASPVPLAPSIHLLQAHVRLSSGMEAEVVNIHLTPPAVRYDLWSPTSWREHRATRTVQRRQMRDIAAQVATVARAMPVIAGGDFNAPAGDAVFRLLKPRLHDTFREAGTGWGNTVLNEFPVARIDQVWASKHFRVVAVAARRTRHSDHRMVVCDLVLR